MLFRSRKARQPIYILRFKNIEQGQLLYPKIFPLTFYKIFSHMGGYKHLLEEKITNFEVGQSAFQLTSLKCLSIGIWEKSSIGYLKSFETGLTHQSSIGHLALFDQVLISKLRLGVWNPSIKLWSANLRLSAGPPAIKLWSASLRLSVGPLRSCQCHNASTSTSEGPSTGTSYFISDRKSVV